MNSEHIKDPTADKAIANVMREQKKGDHKAHGDERCTKNETCKATGLYFLRRK